MSTFGLFSYKLLSTYPWIYKNVQNLNICQGKNWEWVGLQQLPLPQAERGVI